MVQHRIGASLVGFARAGCEADEVSVILSTSETFRVHSVSWTKRHVYFIPVA